MPAYNPTSKGNKSIVKLSHGVFNNNWHTTIDGYKIYKLKNILANQYNSLMMNVQVFSNSQVVDSTMGDVSLGVENGSSILDATKEPLKYITGSLDWNLTPFTTERSIFNFLWTNSDVNLEDMAPKYTGVEAIYPEYRPIVETNKTGVLPYMSNFVDILFRQEVQTNIVVFAWTLYGINNIT